MNSDWEKGGLAGGQDTKNSDPLHPAFRVHVDDAYRFARWLGGYLPSTKQWDKAAGCYDENAGDGPYLGLWDENDPNQIAVNRGLQGPMQVGTATRDRSRYGIRDMAGNGREWTRDLLDVNNRTVPVANPKTETVLLRGKSYLADRPLRFKDLETRPEGTEYLKPKFDIGFRVVIEPD
jgi:formylglycine-generating enzyme required for sulfatase activity